jgi:hypothetical protein
MDHNDNALDTPRVDDLSDASVDDDDAHQRTVSPAVVQALSSPKSPLATTTLILGDSMFRKRKATGSPVPAKDCTSGTVNAPLQTSPEPTAGHDR